MQIHDKSSLGITETTTDRTQQTRSVGDEKGASRAGQTQTSSSDQVALSSAQRYAEQAEELGAAQRKERIDQLQKDFEAGRYRVDAGEVSRAMVRSMITGDFRTDVD